MKDVVMFTTQTCSSCKIAKKFLTQNNIMFELKDINVDAKAREELQQRNISGVPTFLIGKDFVTGSNRQKFLNLLTIELLNAKNVLQKYAFLLKRVQLRLRARSALMNLTLTHISKLLVPILSRI